MSDAARAQARPVADTVARALPLRLRIVAIARAQRRPPPRPVAAAAALLRIVAGRVQPRRADTRDGARGPQARGAIAVDVPRCTRLVAAAST